ncbi:MAG TPA: CoA transferase, partial [Burkholderiaceae bacterium]
MTRKGDRPLAGLKVVDLTKLLPGPLATSHLAEMGAEVTKIEGPARDGQDDPMRHTSATAEDRAAGRPSLA